MVFCPIGLGNFIMVRPALALLSTALGRENLALFSLKKGITQLADESALFAEIFTWDPDAEGLGPGLGLLRTLRRRRFLHLLSLFPTGHWKYALFTRLLGIPDRWGFAYPHQSLAGRVQTHALPLDFDLHDAEQNLRLVRAFLAARPGAGTEETSASPVSAPFPTEARPAGAAMTGPSGIPSAVLSGVVPSGAVPSGEAPGAFFVCHPGSSAERGMAEKRLPPDRFAALILKIHADFGLPALLIGGPEEADLRDTLRRRVEAENPGALVSVPTKSLAEVSALIAKSAFFLGNDSGLMHIAAGLGKPCLVFFGPTDERRTGPDYGRAVTVSGKSPDPGRPDSPPANHHVLRRRDLPCAPCWTLRTLGKNPPCIYGDTRCLRHLDVESFYPEIAAHLHRLGFRPIATPAPTLPV